jgi:hypothetical protein
MGEANVIPRRCTLARLVLSSRLTISILSLGLLMTSFSGCVLPVGPRFEDPPAIDNLPPFFRSTTPLQGSTVTAAGATYTFNATVSDPNVADTLYARWLGEYPTYSPSSFKLKDQVFSSTSGQPWDATPSLTTSCVDPYVPGQPRHTITLLVSDRAFWDPGVDNAPTDRETLLTSNPETAQTAQASWVLILTCPPN